MLQYKLNAILIEKLLYKISEKTKMGAKSWKPHNPYTGFPHLLAGTWQQGCGMGYGMGFGK